MATSGLLKKLVPFVPVEEMPELNAEAFSKAFESWDPNKGTASYADSFNAWKGVKLLGEVQTFLRSRAKAIREDGDVALVPARGNILRSLFNQEVRGIIASALNFLSPQGRALVREHFWGEKALNSAQHKALAQALAGMRSVLLARGYTPQDLIWDCGPRAASRNLQADLFAA